MHGPVRHPLNKNFPTFPFRNNQSGRMHTFLHTTMHKASHIIYHWIDLAGLKYIILVIKTADDSTARHASWISCAALWIPGSAGQGQPANLPCDVMPLSERGGYTHPAVRVWRAAQRKGEVEGEVEGGNEGSKKPGHGLDAATKTKKNKRAEDKRKKVCMSWSCATGS